MSRPRVFFDMTADGESLGRIVMEVSANLFEFEAVRMNFRALYYMPLWVVNENLPY